VARWEIVPSIPHSEFRTPHSVRGVVMETPIVDSHVHFWDPAELHYPWLEGLPSLERAFLPPEYRTATGGVPPAKIIFVECNCLPEEARTEVQFVERLVSGESCIAGIVAFADLADASERDRALEAVSSCPTVKGIRQNIQGQPAGFALQPAFVEGVRAVGRRGLSFDLCVTHDQLQEITDLVRRCSDTRFVLDHCGKPAIRDRRLEPWRADIARLAAQENVCCKLSGLFTEAEPERWREEDLIPYAAWVVESFGTERVLYGSDWPVLTLAGRYCDWYGFTERFTAGWTAAERRRFYGDNAIRVYGL
jgi:L-fuconolactonase